MSAHPPVQRDERTVAVANVGYRYAYAFVTFALLADAAWRAVMRQEAAWDLMALVIVGGAICAAYQARQKALPRGWVGAAVLIAAVGAVVGILVVWLGLLGRH